MSLIIPANTLASGGYAVDNSCRFATGSSAYMKKAQSGGNREKWTYSTWVKKTLKVANSILINPIGVNIAFNTPHTLYMDVSGVGRIFETNALYRDVSAWYHIVVAFNTTDYSTVSAGQVKVYVNGVEQTFASTTNMSVGFDSGMNQSGVDIGIGRDENGDNNYADYYLAETVLIDGQQLTPTDFGEFDEDSGIWKPIDVSGLTFGTNGFYLDFENSAALGADVSGNSNNFTVNNLTAIDQSTDTCTNNGATLNSLLNPNGATLSEGNLKSSKSNAHAIVQSTIPCGFPNASSTAKFYWETKMTAADGRTVGLIKSSTPQQAPYYNSYLGSQSGGDGLIGYYLGTYVDSSESNVYYKGSLEITISTGFSTGNIMIHAYDASTGKYWQGKNGTWFTYGGGAGDPANGNYPLVTLNATDRTHDIFPAESSFNGRWSWNFGSPPFAISSGNQDGNGYGNFEYAVPSGYFSLNTKNLAEYG